MASAGRFLAVQDRPLISQVWSEYYREEHRYCECEEGLHDPIRHHLNPGVSVRASRLVPLGPWCVYWSECFPKGYRLEGKVVTEGLSDRAGA